MHFDETARDRQAQTQAGLSSRYSAVSLPKGFKYVRQEFRRYPCSGIAYNNAGMRVGALQFDLNAPARGSEFDCVGEQIPNDLLEPVCISEYSICRSIKNHFELQALGFSRRVDGIHCCL